MVAEPGSDDILAHQIDYYEARAAEYDRWFLRQGRYDRGPAVAAAWFEELEAVRAALAQVPLDGADVCELACGTGLWTEPLCRRAARVTAVDASLAMLEACRRRVGPDAMTVELVEADLFRWRPPQRYDAVVFCFWISHVPAARLGGFLATVAEALRPGGSVFFVDSLREQASLAVDHRLPDPGEERMVRRLDDGRSFTIVKNFWPPTELEARCAVAGLDVAVHSTPTYFQYGLGVRRH